MADFMSVIDTWIEETEQHIDRILRTLIINIGESVVELSPVDTGRFKGNWQMTVNSPATASLLRYDKSGSITLADIRAKANTFTAGEVAYIQNHVLYGHDLEYGSSRQSEGMVRITKMNFLRLLDDAIKKSNR